MACDGRGSAERRSWASSCCPATPGWSAAIYRGRWTEGSGPDGAGVRAGAPRASCGLACRPWPAGGVGAASMVPGTRRSSHHQCPRCCRHCSVAALHGRQAPPPPLPLLRVGPRPTAWPAAPLWQRPRGRSWLWGRQGLACRRRPPCHHSRCRRPRCGAGPEPAPARIRAPPFTVLCRATIPQGLSSLLSQVLNCFCGASSANLHPPPPTDQPPLTATHHRSPATATPHSTPPPTAFESSMLRAAAINGQ